MSSQPDLSRFIQGWEKRVATQSPEERLLDVCDVAVRDPRAEYAAKRWIIDEMGSEWALQIARWFGGSPTFGDCLTTSDERFADITGFLTSVAWYARDCGHPAINVVGDADVDSAKSSAQQFALVFLMLQSSRFDFNCRKIENILGRHFQAVDVNNVGTVFDLFAKVSRGDRRFYSDAEIEAIFVETHSFKLRQLIVHALWLEPSPSEGRLLEELSHRLIRQDPTDAISYMRYAEGLRRNQDYITAVEILDEGLEKLDASETLVHQDFVRQRMMVVQELQAEDRFDRKVQNFDEELEKVVKRITEDMRAESQKMLFRSIELLGLFIALLGVLAGTVGMAFIGQLAWHERVLIMLSSSTMVVGFFFLLMYIIRKQK